MKQRVKEIKEKEREGIVTRMRRERDLRTGVQTKDIEEAGKEEEEEGGGDASGEEGVGERKWVIRDERVRGNDTEMRRK